MLLIVSDVVVRAVHMYWNEIDSASGTIPNELFQPLADISQYAPSNRFSARIEPSQRHTIVPLGLSLAAGAPSFTRPANG